MIALIYITVKDKAEAIKIAKELLAKKLIACANIFDGVISVYEWGGELCEEGEVVMILKTKDELFEIVRDKILTLSSYENPAIVKLSASDASEKFASWVETQTL
ncbi:MAG: divalent-cation tolerance protein CutA [Campylobacterales bacterium]|nr:divalent-cation tolerance protein CutA [Campylobacterales bacterium]